MIHSKKAERETLVLDTFAMIGDEEVSFDAERNLAPLVKPLENGDRIHIATETDVYGIGGNYISGIREALGRGFANGAAIHVAGGTTVPSFLFNVVEELYALERYKNDGFLEGYAWDMIYGASYRYAALTWLGGAIDSIRAQFGGTDIDMREKVLLVSKFMPSISEHLYGGLFENGRGVNVAMRPVNFDAGETHRIASEQACMANMEEKILGGFLRRELKKVDGQMYVMGMLRGNTVPDAVLEQNIGTVGEYIYADITAALPGMLRRIGHAELKTNIIDHYSAHFAVIHPGVQTTY